MLAALRAIALVSLGLIGLTACGAGRTMILQSPAHEYRSSGYRMQQADSTAPVPAEIVARFESAVRERTRESGLAANDELLLKYRFIQFEAGDQFQRWFWGGIGNAGEGSLTCEVTYLDSEGKDLAKVQCEGRIGSGFLGGTMEDALGRMAQEVAEYTVQNFARTDLAPLPAGKSSSTSD